MRHPSQKRFWCYVKKYWLNIKDFDLVQPLIVKNMKDEDITKFLSRWANLGIYDAET